MSDIRFLRVAGSLQAKVPNNSSLEPALKVGGWTSTVAGLLGLVNWFAPEFLGERGSSFILVISAFLLPLLTAVMTRPKVWSPSSVQDAINNAMDEAEKAIKDSPLPRKQIPPTIL